MLIIADKRIPEKAQEQLRSFGSLFELESSGIVYPAISGHPDIFMCNTGSSLIVAPNAPAELYHFLTAHHVSFQRGTAKLGNEYPATSNFNAVVTEKYLVHNLKHTDKSILEACQEKIHIHVNQAYTRCNLIALNEADFITSDKGIEKALKKQMLNVLYFDPAGIVLPGFVNGFFGGCCGINGNNLFITGSLKYYKQKDSVMDFIKNCRSGLIELYDGKLFDAGGIFFINQ